MILHSIFVPIILITTFVLSSDIPRGISGNGTVIDQQLSAVIQDLMKANNITGMSVGILASSGEVEFGAWGNRTETGEKVASDTIFGIGSASKGFLSASLGILMQDFSEGKNTTALPYGVKEFNWETKMRDLLPGEWKTEDEFSTDKADLTDLLSHVTGLPTHDASYSADESPRDLVLRMRNLRAAYEFRQRFEYNNQMFITGSYVVSKLSGMEYRDFVEKRIMLPLNMSSSTMHPDRVSRSNRFSQTWTPSGRRIPFFMDEQMAALIAGAGAVISTAEDLLLWAKLILNGGVNTATNVTIIPKSTFDLTTTGHSILLNQGEGPLSVIEYGLGWARLAYRGHELIVHNGGAPGVSAFCAVFPNDNFAVVVFANTASTGTQNTALAVADHILGLPSASSGPAAAPAAPKVTVVPRAVPPAPPPKGLSGLAGTYWNEGYGNFTLCGSATSPHCAAVVQDFRKVDAAAGKPANPSELYSAWARFWGTHLRLTPISGNDFDAKLSWLRVDGYGADHTPFDDSEDSINDWKVTFMEENGKVVGLGFFVAENESWRAKEGGSVRDIADAWFDKI